MIKINSLSIRGYKSIKDISDFQPGNINVLIGPNGAGKSNFISFFSFLSWTLNSGGQLQYRIEEMGGANDILHDGADISRDISCAISIETDAGINDYQFTLSFAKPDRLIFSDERYRYSAFNKSGVGTWQSLGQGHLEARLPQLTENPTAKTIHNLLKKLIVYQFHNTSDTAALRLKWSAYDGRWLKQHAENLGSFLYRLQNEQPGYYHRIVLYIRSVLPFFLDFDLYEQFGQVLLRWKEKNSQKIFHAGLASDGMLRTIALITLLAQPEDDLPASLFLDEPELGLHPAAIELVAGLVKTASEYCQIFISTQSVSLVNQFDIEDLVVINRIGRYSTYTRPNQQEIASYLEEFSTGELWDKNIIGGRP